MPPDSTPVAPPEQPVETPAESQSWLAGIVAVFRAIFSWAILPVLIVLFLHAFFFQAFRVVGNSMVPTLHEQDYLIISKVSASLQRAKLSGGRSGYYIPKRGEVVVFKYPQNPELVFVKRVIGLPGERVRIADGKVTVYSADQPGGFNPDTSYNLDEVFTMGEVNEIVPAGTVFVLGDNRSLNGSFDSREWGFLSSQYIIGRTVMRLLPLDKLQFFSQLPGLALNQIVNSR